MSLDKLKNDLKNADMRKLYYIHGSELYLKQFYLSQIKMLMLAGDPDKIDLLELDGANLSAEELSEALASIPVICARKLIVVYDISFSCQGIAWLTANPEALSEETVTVFFDSAERVRADGSPAAATEASKRFSLFIKEYGLDVKIDGLDDRMLTAWLSKQARLRSRTISAATAGYMISCVGKDMLHLMGEIGKLCAYCEYEITKEAIDDICVKTEEAKLYELTDAVISGNAVKALFILDTLLSMKTEPVAICSAVGGYTANLYRLYLMDACGTAVKEMASATGMRDFAVKKALNRVRKLSEQDISKMLDACTKCDLALKSTTADPSTLLTELISELIYLC